MYLWILLFVLGIALVLYYTWQKREPNDDKVVLPRQRQHSSGEDLETANEMNVTDNMNIVRSKKNDLEMAEELNETDLLDFDEAVRKIHEQQGLTTTEWSKQPLERKREKERLDLNFRKIPIPRNIANDTTLEMDKMEFGVIDQVIHIGEKPERISGHEMKIDLQLSPRMIALNKDPYWTYLYWNLPATLPEGKWELKIKDLTQGMELYQDIDPIVGRWYLHLNQPGHRFNFELGVWNGDGSFEAILVSNEILTPPNKPSNEIDAEWATIEELYQGKFMNLIRAESSSEFMMAKNE